MAWKYKVAGWDEWFESAKSKGYKHKSQCYTPNKHGLGYLRLVRRDNGHGAALFGAWRAMADVLSRQAAPRHGYLTDTGLPDGAPLSTKDLSDLTSMPEDIFTELLSVCSSQAVGWLMVANSGIPQGYCEDTTGAYHGKGEGKGKGEGSLEGGAGETTPCPPVCRVDHAHEWPLTLVLEVAARPTVGVPPEMAAAFHDHFAGVGWQDGTVGKRRITDLGARMRKWKVDQPSHGLKMAAATSGVPEWKARARAAAERQGK